MGPASTTYFDINIVREVLVLRLAISRPLPQSLCLFSVLLGASFDLQSFEREANRYNALKVIFRYRI